MYSSFTEARIKLTCSFAILKDFIIYYCKPSSADLKSNFVLFLTENHSTVSLKINSCVPHISYIFSTVSLRMF